MKLKTLLRKSWLPLVKGAGRALALTEGLLVVAILAIVLSLFNIIPTSATSSITIETSSSSAVLEPGIDSDETVYIGGHSVTINAQSVLGYNATVRFSSIKNDANLVNIDKPNAAPIVPVSDNHALALGFNQWGYLPNIIVPMAANESNSEDIGWRAPTTTDTTIVNEELPNGGDKQTRLDVVYGAKLDINTLTKGTYQTTATYTATAIPTPDDPGGEICQSGNLDNNCQVDIDANMIPVRYTGNETAPEWTVTDPSTTGWYDYGNKQWANVVTVSKTALDSNKYKNADGAYKVGTVVDEADVLDYWVYIPRYAYQVMRRNATDKVVTDEKAIDMGGFNIRFQESPSISTDTKDRIVEPKKCDNSNANQYYQDCVNKWETWATHPAFRWCTNINYDTGERSGCTELNGIWVGKFETTGTASDPTVLPNGVALGSMNVGEQFDAAKSIGVTDNVSTNYGNGGSIFGKHNLSKTTSHMTKNSEWGAAVYLSSSKYGSGINNVKINAAIQTGCGPVSADSEATSSTCNPYTTKLGQSASTTGNTSGIYDMSGGAYEDVMGSVSTNGLSSVATEFVKVPIKPPYIDLYPTAVFTFTDIYQGNNQCTWYTCGGHAIHETKNVQVVTQNFETWGGDFSHMLPSYFMDRGGAHD